MMKQLVLPGKHGMPASAFAKALNTAGPPWNGGLLVSAKTGTDTVCAAPSHGYGIEVNEEPDPCAIDVPEACSTLTLRLLPTNVSEGSNGGQVTVTGTVISTRDERLGAPRLIVIPASAAAVDARTAAPIAATKTHRIFLMAHLLSTASMGSAANTGLTRWRAILVAGAAPREAYLVIAWERAAAPSHSSRPG
jgi:hypothetical protein